MTRLNFVLTGLLVLGVVLPGGALASGMISDSGFGGIMARVIPGMALFLLVNNIVALVNRRN